MLIGIDGNEANVEKRVGVNQYAYELLRHLHKRQTLWRGRHEFIIYLQNKPLGHMPEEKDGWRYKILPGKRLWIITRLMPHLFLTRKKPDIIFTPNHYVPPFAPMARVCSIMDLGFLRFPGQFRRYDYWQLRLWTAWSVFVSKQVIAISSATKRDILDHYKFAKKKVNVTYLGYDKGKLKTQKGKNKYGVKGEYILFLSTLKPSKNIEGLLEAFSSISHQSSDTKLVIAGKKGWLYESIFKKVKQLKLEKKVVFVGFVPEEDKAALIAGAKLFVLPSFWEGFGLDILSAMALGVPVVAADRGSIPEVVGNAGILINPDDSKDIANGIKKVLEMSKKDYNKLVKAGIKHAQQFSWDRTAGKTMEIFEKACP